MGYEPWVTWIILAVLCGEWWVLVEEGGVGYDQFVAYKNYELMEAIKIPQWRTKGMAQLVKPESLEFL